MTIPLPVFYLCRFCHRYLFWWLWWLLQPLGLMPLLLWSTWLMVSGCSHQQPLVVPQPDLQQQLLQVPLIFPHAPVHGYHLDRGASDHDSWRQWLEWLDQPPVVAALPRPVVAEAALKALRNQSREWRQWLEQQARGDDHTARTVVAMGMLQGLLWPEDAAQGLAWLNQSADSGSGFAAWQRARLALARQESVAPRTLQHWLTLAARQGHSAAALLLAHCYRDGRGLVPDMKQSAHWYQQVLEQSNDVSERTQALLNLGLLQYFQLGHKNSPNPGQAWLQAAESGSARGALLAALVESRPKQQEQLLRQAIAGGLSEACNQLGLVFWQRRDYTSAAHWFGMGRKMGDKLAGYNLGVCYVTGLGVAPSAHRAMLALTGPAGQGLPEARRLLAFLYWQRPQQLPPKTGRAQRLFADAARQGDLYSLYALSLIEGIGQGVPRNYSQAWASAAVVAAWGVPEAASIRDLLSARMNPHQRQRGHKQAQTLIEHYRTAVAPLKIMRQPPSVIESLVMPPG